MSTSSQSQGLTLSTASSKFSRHSESLPTRSRRTPQSSPEGPFSVDRRQVHRDRTIHGSRVGIKTTRRGRAFRGATFADRSVSSGSGSGLISLAGGGNGSGVALAGGITRESTGGGITRELTGGS